MSEYLIQSETLTGIADDIRILSGDTGNYSTAQMKEKTTEAITEVESQVDIISQIKTALEGKASVGGNGGGVYATYCWRVSTSDGNKDIIPTMTANVTGEYEVFASTEISNDRKAFAAFDDITSTNSEKDRWHSDSGLPQYIGVRFPQPVHVVAFSVKNVENNHASIENFELQNSSDGVDWQTVGSCVNSKSNSDKTLFFTGTDDEKQYWRLYITSVYSGSYCVIDEIEFYDELNIDLGYVVSGNPDSYPKNGYGTDGRYYTRVL